MASWLSDRVLTRLLVLGTRAITSVDLLPDALGFNPTNPLKAHLHALGPSETQRPRTGAHG